MVSKRQRRVYKALVDGAHEGNTDDALYRFVLMRVPTAKRKTIVGASVLAMGDKAVNDPLVLQTIFSLAIKQRFIRSDRRKKTAEELPKEPPLQASATEAPLQ